MISDVAAVQLAHFVDGDVSARIHGASVLSHLIEGTLPAEPHLALGQTVRELYDADFIQLGARGLVVTEKGRRWHRQDQQARPRSGLLRQEAARA